MAAAAAAAAAAAGVVGVGTVDSLNLTANVSEFSYGVQLSGLIRKRELILLHLTYSPPMQKVGCLGKRCLHDNHVWEACQD